LKIHLDKEPYFLVYQNGDKHQVVRIDKVNKGEPDFIARVTYLTTEQGGRIGYAASGYRPHVKFDGRKELTSGEQLFIDKDKVFPGETVTAEIRILGTDFFKNYLFVGQHFEVAEASHLVDTGKSLKY
jgi:translation elongation factor EF-Tu-like GTPase